MEKWKSNIAELFLYFLLSLTFLGETEYFHLYLPHRYRLYIPHSFNLQLGPDTYCNQMFFSRLVDVATSMSSIQIRHKEMHCYHILHLLLSILFTQLKISANDSRSWTRHFFMQHYQREYFLWTITAIFNKRVP